jgi:hypothetical protein
MLTYTERAKSGKIIPDLLYHVGGPVDASPRGLHPLGQQLGGPIVASDLHAVSKCIKDRCKQCCGSMTFWCGSRSFITDLQDPNKKIILKKFFLHIYFLKVLLHHFSKIKVKRSHIRVEIKVFLTKFA